MATTSIVTTNGAATLLEVPAFIFNSFLSKGAAIVHMFRNVLGDNVFRAGLQKYLSKYSFKAAVTNDLIDEFQRAYDEGPNSDKPLNLKDAMTPWLLQKGYPMINVIRNYTTGDTEVCQKSTIIGDVFNKWWIPLTYATKSSLNFSSSLPTSWISDKEDCVKIIGIDKDDWVVANVRASGYYRVNYDDENWNRLANYLNTENYKKIHVLNRAQLISDAFYLAELEPNRYYGIFYKLIKYLSREVEYLPWRSAYNAILRIDESLKDTNAHQLFVEDVLELMHNFIEKIGFEERHTDDHFTKQAKADIIPWACLSGHKGCSQFASEKLMRILEEPENEILSLIGITAAWLDCAGLRVINVTMAKKLFGWSSNNLPYGFVGHWDCTDNHELHRILLNRWRNNYLPERLRYKDFTRLLSSSEENFNFTVDFILENHQALLNSFHKTGATFTPVTVIHNHVKTKGRLEKFKQLLHLATVVGGPEIFNETEIIDKAKKNIAKGDASAALFLQSRGRQLSADNPKNDSRIEIE